VRQPRSRPWTDTALPLAERVELLLGEMTLEEKVAQLAGVWVGKEPRSGNVAPMQEAFAEPATFEEASADGLGHITRPLGTRPVDPVDGAAARRPAAGPCRPHPARRAGDRPRGVPDGLHDVRRLGVPDALALAATFDPGAVERMTRAVGASMRESTAAAP
jgi:beta-xylosidase